MSETGLQRIEVRRHLLVTAERAFDAFLDPRVARHFLFATATGEMIEAEVEPCVGGAFAFTERRPDMGDVRHVGRFTRLERPGRLSFAFAVPQFDPRESFVDIHIEARGEACEARLVHEGVAAEFAAAAGDGWGRILDSLAPALGGVHAAGWRR